MGLQNSKWKYDEVYPNSPLKEVAFEIRFPGRMEIECQRHLFHNEIITEYPKIYVPTAHEGKAMALTHYRFRDEQDNETVMLALNSFGFSTNNYEGHEQFIYKISGLIEKLTALYPIDEITRLGWRYINIIPFVREKGAIPLDNFFNVKIPYTDLENVEQIALMYKSRLDKGFININLSELKRHDGEEALLLDIDCALEHNLSIKGIEESTDYVHKKGREVFENLITDDYRNYLRGGEI